MCWPSCENFKGYDKHPNVAGLPRSRRWRCYLDRVPFPSSGRDFGPMIRVICQGFISTLMSSYLIINISYIGSKTYYSSPDSIS